MNDVVDVMILGLLTKTDKYVVYNSWLADIMYF